VPDGTAALGEITLSGRLRKVESLPQRLAAANRAEIDRLVLPELNRPDVEEYLKCRPAPQAQIAYVSSTGEAIAEAFAAAASTEGKTT
jgi:ATP-dependent Lon protease